MALDPDTTSIKSNFSLIVKNELESFKNDIAKLKNGIKNKLFGNPGTGTTSAGHSVSSIPSRALPPVKSVKDAFERLTEHGHVNNLWKEKITDKNPVMKIFGAIAYIFGKSAAGKLDKSATDLSQKADALAVAVVNRFWNNKENIEGNRILPTLNAIEQEQYGTLQDEADIALEQFYDAYKERIKDLKANSAELKFYKQAVDKLLNDRFAPNSAVLSRFDASNKKIIVHNLPKKIETTRKELDKKHFADMVAGFAAQPFSDITKEAFDQQITDLDTSFPTIFSENREENRAGIASALRLEIQGKHENELRNRINDLREPDDAAGARADYRNERLRGLVGLEEQLRTSYTKTQTEAQDAYNLMNWYLIESQDLHLELQALQKEHGHLLDNTTPQESLEILDRETNPSPDAETLSNARDKLTERLTAAVQKSMEETNKYNKLTADLNTIRNNLVNVQKTLNDPSNEVAIVNEIKALIGFYDQILSEKQEDNLIDL